MTDWRIYCPFGTLCVQAETEQAAREEAICQVTAARIRVWQGWIVIDLASQSVAVEADTKEAAREEAIRQITTSSVGQLKLWRVETDDCFFVEAETKEQAYEEAKKIMETEVIKEHYSIFSIYDKEEE